MQMIGQATYVLLYMYKKILDLVNLVDEHPLPVDLSNKSCSTGTFRSDEGPPAIAELVDKCLDDDPSKRPTAKEVLEILLANKPTFALGHV